MTDEVEQGELVPVLPGRWGLYPMKGEGAEPDADVDLSTLSFDALVRYANDQHALVSQASNEALASMSRGLIHAIRVGEALLLIRDQVPAGSWKRWQAENLTFSLGSSKRYTRFATYKDELLRAPEFLTSHTAYEYLRGLPSMENRSYDGVCARDPEKPAVWTTEGHYRWERAS